MTFSRIKGAGWSINEKLTSVQITQLDLEHALAIDKTGDTTTGAIHIGTGSSLILDSGSTGSVLSTVTIGAGGKLTTASTGKIEMGNNDYPTLSSTHTGKSRTITIPFSSLVKTYDTGFTYTTDATYSVSTTVAAQIIGSIPKSALHIGAKLSSIEVYFVVPAVKTMAPETPPKMFMQAMPALTVGSVAPSPIALHSTTPTQYYTPAPTPGTGGVAGWVDSHVVKSLVYTLDQNNVIAEDVTYFLSITDEDGIHAEAGNQYYSIAFNYTDISDLRFA